MGEPVYTAREVARVVGVPDARVQYWHRTGLCTASLRRGGRLYYTFSDLVSVKAARELLDRGASLANVRRALVSLRLALPEVDRPLTRLRVVSNGSELVVIADDVAFEPLSGQVVMDFFVGALSARAAEVRALPGTEDADGAPGITRSAWGWFLEASARHDAGDPVGAEIALRRALEEDPHLAAAHTNLGNLAWAGGRTEEAEERYRLALDLDPEQPEARFNLGNLLAERGEPEAALREWSRVAALHPDFSDAQFQLGAALADAGAAEAARFHLRRFLQDEAEGGWATSARELLAALPA